MLESVRGRREIDALFRSGRRLHGKTISLIYAASPDGHARLSVFVPRRLAGAVGKNRFRRVLSEFARTNPHPALAGKCIIVLCRKPVTVESTNSARDELRRLMAELPMK